MSRKPRRDIFYERNIFVSRSIQVGLIMLLCIGLLGAQLVKLQYLESSRYITASEDNRITVRATEPVRGRIFDRSGSVVAENQHSNQLVLTPTDIPDLDETIASLHGIIDIEERDMVQFNKMRKLVRAYDSIPIRSNLTAVEVAKIAAVNHKYTGVDITDVYDRVYPHGEAFGHVVGYIGRINDKELTKRDNEMYSSSAYIGKTGLELFYERQIRGKPGVAKHEVNVSGRTVRVLAETKPIPGRDFYLTIDHRLQKKAFEVMGKETGALVAIEPMTGEILSMVSTPVFDPNLFVGGISTKDYRALADNPERPLFDRAIKAAYPPGSTIKPHIVLQALSRKVVKPDYKYRCQGYFQIPGVEHKYRDWAKRGHGWVNLYDSIEQSCDVMFYDIAFNMGIDTLSKSLEEFGFNRKTGIDLMWEFGGIVPSREWKIKTIGERWYPGETIIAGIGQGYVTTTPLQLAYSTALLASRGKTPKPHLQRGYKDKLTGVFRPFVPSAPDHKIEASDAQWKFVERGMHKVNYGPRGTARRIFGGERRYSSAGKTGTAQVVGIAQDSVYNADALERKHRDHALFVGYAPLKDPQIAVALIVEHGGSGGRNAAPIAKKLMDYYLLALKPAQQLEAELK